MAMDFDKYLILLDKHPGVQAMIENHRALKYQAAGAMGLPDPTVFLGVDNVPVNDPAFDRYLPSAKVIGFSQSIPNGAGRRAQREMLLFSAATTGLLAAYEKSKLHSLFFSRIADLHRVEQQTGLLLKKLEIISELQSYYDGQLLGGEPVYQQSFAVEIKRAEIEQRLNSLIAEQAAIEAEFIRLVGEVPDADRVPVREKSWSGEPGELYPVLLANNSISEQQARVNFADSEYQPDFGLMASYKIREDGENDSFAGEDWFSIQVRMTIPLWSKNNQQPKLEAAKSRQKSAELHYHDTVRRWKMETSRLTSEKHAAARNMEVLKKKKSALEEKIQAIKRSYSAGQIKLLPLLQAELSRLSLLFEIAGEKARLIKISEEFNAHLVTAATTIKQ